MIKPSIEDCLELLVGLQEDPTKKFKVISEDYSVLTSIGRQVFKGVGLTDRQYELVKTKLLAYQDMFDHNLTESFTTLRIPLRELNREKTIKIVSMHDDETILYIAVKFIFNKKLLTSIERVKQAVDGHCHTYDSIEKVHYFLFNEHNAFAVVKNFKNNNFEIQPELLTYYNKVEIMNNNEEDHIPGIYSFKLKNLTDKAINFMVSSIGKPSKENLAIYNDRKEQLGLYHFEQEELENSLNALTVLSKKIVTRKLYTVLISPEKYPIERVIESLLELNRFPLLVILPNDNSLDGLIAVHSGLTNIFFNEDISVLFRVDNDTGRNFNEYIKTNKLNNPIDSNTKVVYINTNKFPKPLLKSNWIPSAVLTIGSQRMNTKVNDYISPMDLVIHYDTDITPFTRIKADKL